MDGSSQFMFATERMIDATNVEEARVKYDFLPKITQNITVAQATKIIDS